MIAFKLVAPTYEFNENIWRYLQNSKVTQIIKATSN